MFYTRKDKYNRLTKSFSDINEAKLLAEIRPFTRRV